MANETLCLWLELESKITEFDSPNYFFDEMQRGSFKSFRHEHIFDERDRQTLMTDLFDYKSPLGLLGKFADWLFLKKYMHAFPLKEFIQNFVFFKNNFKMHR